MRTRKTIIMLTIAFLLMATASAFAQKGMGRAGERPGKTRPGLQGQPAGLHELLELAPDQIKQLEDMRIEMQKKLIPLQSDLKMAGLELQELIRDDAAKTSIDAKIDEIGGIRSKMQKIRVGHRIDFKSILTDEQKLKLESMPMGRPGFGSGRGHHGCRGGGLGFGRFGGDCPRLAGDGI